MAHSELAPAEIKKLGVVLLRIGALLQSNGTYTSRIRNTIDIIANAYGYHADVFITQRALTLTVSNDQHEPVFNGLRRTTPPGVNFKLVNSISGLAKDIKEHPQYPDQINLSLDQIEKQAHYPRLLLLSLVAISGACFCGLANGNYAAMGIAFAATFIGLFVRQEAHKRRFNAYLCVFFAAFAATLTAGAFRYFLPQGGFEASFATSVLFLIPGVPLINSFTDLMDGNILNGMLRAGHGLIISFMIALGIICSLLIYHF